LLDEERKNATAFVHEDQLSLAIGRNGQNVRLATKLTGWKIDVVEKKKEAGEEKAEEGEDEKKEEAEA